MSHREDLVEKLITEMHLSVPERAGLSSKTVSYSEVAAVITGILDKTGYFPPNARPWQEGSVVHEGAILQKLPDGGIRLTLQRSHPIAPRVLAEKKESEFKDAATAIKAFIHWEWGRSIDGIPIVGIPTD